MSERISLTGNRNDIVKNIRNSIGTPVPSAADMDNAWESAWALEERKNKDRRPGIEFPRLTPAFGAAFALIAVLAVILFFGFYGRPGFFKKNEIRISRFSGGLSIEKNGMKSQAGLNTIVAAGDRVINESGVPAVFTAEGSFRASLSPEGRAVFLTSFKKDRLNSDIRLENGSMDFSVKKLLPDETFHVICSGMTVSVVGTVFRVSMTNRGVEIAAYEGEVSVLRNGKDFKELHVKKGWMYFIPEKGNPQLFPLTGILNGELSRFSEKGISLISNNTAILEIKTSGAAGTVYFNGENMGRTPAGLEIKKDMSFDLEAAGNNGRVARSMGMKLKSNKTMSIDLNRENGLLYPVLTEDREAVPLMALQDGTLAVIRETNGWIYHLNSRQLNKFTGAEAGWKVPPVIDGDAILLINAGGAAESYDNSAHKAWTLGVPGTVWYGAVCAHNGSLYALATMDRGIYLFNLNGKMIDHIDSAKAGPGYSSPVLDEKNILYYIDESGRLTAYSIPDGREIWNTSLPSVPAHPLLETENTVIVYFRVNGSINAYSKSDGKMVWTAGIPETSRREIHLAAAGGLLTVYCNINNGGRLWSIDLKNGSMRGSLQTEGKIDAVYSGGDLLWAATDDLLLTSYDIVSFKADRIIHLERQAVDIRNWMNTLIVLSRNDFERIELSQ